MVKIWATMRSARFGVLGDPGLPQFADDVGGILEIFLHLSSAIGIQDSGRSLAIRRVSCALRRAATLLRVVRADELASVLVFDLVRWRLQSRRFILNLFLWQALDALDHDVISK